METGCEARAVSSRSRPVLPIVCVRPQALRTLAGVDPSALTLRDPAVAAGADPGAASRRPRAALRPQDDVARLGAETGGSYVSRVRLGGTPQICLSSPLFGRSGGGSVSVGISRRWRVACHARTLWQDDKVTLVCFSCM